MKAADIKALFLDLDGTLLNDQKQITKGNREAIEKALVKGHKIIINTGRPLYSAIKLSEALELTSEGCYLIAYNGGILYDSGKKKIISTVSIPLEKVYEVFDEINRRGLHIQTYDQTDVLVEPRCDDEAVRRYCSLINMKHRVIDDIHNLNEKPVKMLVIDFDTQEPLEEVRQWILDHHGDTLDAFFSCRQYVEIVKKGLDKGKALLALADLINVPVENTIACGDEANDLAMIKAAGLGAAMQNATAEVKAAADYITELDNNHDGIREIIEKFVL